jgi:predicted DCC family thiol-disulfide oxidoreductase YuxK
MRVQTYKRATIIYDGGCPFCTNYIQLLRLREKCGEVTLINAREYNPIVEEVQQKGYDLNEGFVLVLDNVIFRGADCLNQIALLDLSSGRLGKMNSWLFRPRIVAHIIYPFMRFARGIALGLLGRPFIGDVASNADHDKLRGE